jgi:hypothetical protein
MMTMPTRTPSQPRIIALSVLLYRWLLKLAPGAFRCNYSIPALQDFRLCCSDAYRERGSFGVFALCLLLFAEAIIGILAEHLSEIFGRKQPMLPTIRRSMVATFSAFVLFMIASTALARIADPRAPFDAVGRIHPEIAIAYSIIMNSVNIALLLIMLGGFPFLFTAVKHAIPGGPRGVLKLFVIKPKQALLLLGASLLITICFLSYLLATEFLFSSQHQTVTNTYPPLILALSFIVLSSAITLFVFMILAIATSLSLAVLRSEFSERLLHFALMPIALLALVMGLATLAATTWLIRLWIATPQFATSASGLGNGQTAWVISIIGSMALATLVAAGAFVSGMKASRMRGLVSH